MTGEKEKKMYFKECFGHSPGEIPKAIMRKELYRLMSEPFRLSTDLPPWLIRLRIIH